MQNSFSFRDLLNREKYDMSTTTIKTKFDDWVNTRDTQWLQDNSSDYIIQQFSISFDGLYSNVTEEDLQRFYAFMKPYIYNAKYA